MTPASQDIMGSTFPPGASLSLKRKVSLCGPSPRSSDCCAGAAAAPASTTAASAGTGTESGKSSKRPKTVTSDGARVADWFAKMVCYIWFAPADPSGASRPVTPSQSPLASYAPLHAPWSLPFEADQSASGSSGSASIDSAIAFTPQDSARPFAAQPTMTTFQRRGGPLAREPTQPSRSSMTRLKPRANFFSFVRDILNTTQLSLSVILVAL